MVVKKSATAGTLESSDVYVLVEPNDNGIELTLESSVINQFEKQIRTTISETLERLSVENAVVKVVDKGALDCTLKARIECAVFRACENEEPVAWGDLIV